MKKFLIISGLLTLGVLIGLAGSHTAVSSHIPNQAGSHALYLPLMQSPVSNAPNLNLNVRAATYLGGSADDLAHGLDIAPDRSVVMGGVMPGHNPGGVTPVSLLGGGDGVVVRLDPSGQTVRSVTRLGSEVRDLAVADSGRILVCGDFGVALLNETAAALIWAEDSLGQGYRCDQGSDGTVAVLVKVSNGADQVHIFAADGTALASWSSSGSNQQWHDVAVDGFNQSIILTGYTQKTSTLQVPLIQAWSYDGQIAKWTAYDFSAGDVMGQNLGADSRGELVVMGRDGLLYFAGITDGGNNVYRRQPQDITQSLAGSTLIQSDAYNTPYGLSGAIKFTFYGRFDPGSGQILKGQYLLTRLNNGNGNSIAPHGMMADQNGRLYLAGQSFASMQNRSQRSVAGTAVGPYSGGEPFLLIVSHDFQSRVIWTPFAGSNGAGGSPAYGVSVRQGTAAVAIGLRAGNDNLITYNALQPNRGGGRDAYVATWRQADE